MNKIGTLHAYRAQHKGKEKRVQFIDVIFAAHVATLKLGQLYFNLF
jgi:hypothetical protein